MVGQSARGGLDTLPPPQVLWCLRRREMGLAATFRGEEVPGLSAREVRLRADSGEGAGKGEAWWWW